MAVVVIRVDEVVWTMGVEILLSRTYGQAIPSDG